MQKRWQTLIEYRSSAAVKCKLKMTKYDVSFAEQLLIVKRLNPNILRKLVLTSEADSTNYLQGISSADMGGVGDEASEFSAALSC